VAIGFSGLGWAGETTQEIGASGREQMEFGEFLALVEFVEEG
jgi:hypothetical protein